MLRVRCSICFYVLILVIVDFLKPRAQYKNVELLSKAKNKPSLGVKYKVIFWVIYKSQCNHETHTFRYSISCSNIFNMIIEYIQYSICSIYLCTVYSRKFEVGRANEKL